MPKSVMYDYERLGKLESDGCSFREACKIMGVAKTTLWKWINLHCDRKEVKKVR